MLNSLNEVNLDEMDSFPGKNLNAIINFHHVEFLHELHLARTHSNRARFSRRVSDRAFEILTSRVSIIKGDDEVLDHKASLSEVPEATVAPADADMEADELSEEKAVVPKTEPADDLLDFSSD